MSLIHDALKSMDTAAAAPAAPAPTVRPRATAPAHRAGRPAWLDGALAFAIVVGAGGLGWVYWQSQKPPTLVPAPVAAVPVPVSPVAAAAAAAASLPQVAAPAVEATAGVPAPAAPAQAPAAEPSPALSPAVSSQVAMAAAPAPRPAPVVVVAQAAASPADAAVATTPRPAAAPRPARAVRAAAQPVAVQPPVPAVDDTPVEIRFARFVAAMKNNQTADAERELSALKERLPAGSLGVLRAQAWFDLRAGNDTAAAGQYKAILERMPGDEEAAINLASIQSRRGQHEDARATLDGALRLSPDSAALRSALAQYTPNARQ